MDRESIIGDLKKYAGGAWTGGAQKMTLDTETPPVVAAPGRGRPRKARADVAEPAPIAAAPVRTAEEIAKMIQAPFVVVPKGGLLTTDNATMTVKCEHSHTHTQYITDIIANHGAVTCRTCVGASKFVNMVRDVAADILGIPFSFADVPLRGKNPELVNGEHLLGIECVKAGALVEPPAVLNEHLLVSVPYSTSAKKVRGALIEVLNSRRDWMLDELRAALDTAATADTSKRAVKVAKPAKIFPKDPLPYTDETARAVMAARQITNSFLGKMNMLIVDNEEDLCIENCENKK